MLLRITPLYVQLVFQGKCLTVQDSSVTMDLLTAKFQKEKSNAQSVKKGTT